MLARAQNEVEIAAQRAAELARAAGGELPMTPPWALASAARRRVLLTGVLGLGALVLSGCKGRRAGKWKPLSEDELNGPPRRPTVGATGRGGAVATGGGAPSGVMPRRAWTTAPPAMAYINPMNGISRITVHHAGFPVTARSESEVARLIEGMRRSHTSERTDGNGRPWADIGYHYLIDPAGRVWEGRSVRFQGAHVRNNNENNLGIQLMGHFDEQRPTGEQLAALDAFLADRMRAYRVPLARVYTHQEIMPTACPGRNLQRYMDETRSSGGRLANA